jgi:hypothetical protein
MRTLHRSVITLVLVAMVVAGTLSISGSASERLLYNEDFSTYAPGSRPADWGINDGKGVLGKAEVVEDPQLPSGRALRITHYAKQEKIIVNAPAWEPPADKSRPMAIEYRVRPQGRLMNVYLMNNRSDSAVVTGIGKQILSYFEPTGTEDVCSLEEGWNTIRLIVYGQENEVDVYLNGTLVAYSRPPRTDIDSWRDPFVRFLIAKDSEDQEILVDYIKAWVVDDTERAQLERKRAHYMRQLSLVGLFLTWQRDPTTTMTIDWHYLLSADDLEPYVDYRPTGSQSWLSAQGEVLPTSVLPDRICHRVELLALEPDTEYEFRLAGHDRIFRFKTMPADLSEPIRFAVGGDVGYSFKRLKPMHEAVMAYDPQFIVWGGDIANCNGEIADRWVRLYDAILKTLINDDGRVIPIVTVIGNHEVLLNGYEKHPGFEETDAWRARIAPFFYELMAFPNQPGYGTLDFGDYLSLILLDTNHTNSVTGVQTEWLRQALAERQGRVQHIVPIYHTPAYPAVRKVGSWSRQIQNYWIPLYERAGVRIAFEHHEHAYKRSVPILADRPHPDGIVYLGDGGWGMVPREANPVPGTWYLAHSESVSSGMIITMSEREIDIVSLSSAGDVIDTHKVVDGVHE